MHNTDYPPPKETTENKMEGIGKGFRFNTFEHLK